jgi:tetrapyrrole methylase family protein / MazG family protein
MKKDQFLELLKVIARLRSPKGCAWDRRQTHKTLRKYLREETREAIAAINGGDPQHLEEELGDVLLQVVLHAQIAKENRQFDMDDIIRTLIRKLKRRHPHVFGKTKVNSVKEIINNWEKIKKQERKKK